MNIEHEFANRRAEQRRSAINARIRALHERRAIDRRADSAKIADWIDKFEQCRNSGRGRI